ncbi:MAG TPA: D-alanyl-D-alanine carboxypeptidase/D-alanyl-D-alanine-endopeptidase [Gemmatimonadaceae bacterium]|nr:D-alanyl-D-alanine carboxypeptidase/D-alanyl-D-alanine-endopeptidase [Gemmatimonadaceae bacterium]
MLSHLLLLALTVAPLRPPHRHRRNVPATVPAVRYDAPRSAEALAGDLASQLSRHVRSGHWGAIVVSLTRGDTLYEVNADQPLQPASTMKLFTSALAFERFGPDFQFSTDVLRDGTVDADGTLHGNLILRGDGDPSLSNRFLRGEPDAPMQLLARYVKAAGIKRIDGDIIGDATAFVDQPVPLGWKPRWLTAGYAPRVSALSLNDNLAWVAVSPGSATQAHVGLLPASSAIPINNTVKTVEGSYGTHVVVLARADGGVEARGWIGSRAPTHTVELVIDDPALFTTGALRDALASQGVGVTGKVRLGQTTAGAIQVTSLPSPPLARIVAAMNRESINCYAELLFRDAVRGPQRNGSGSADLGAAMLRDFLNEKVGAPRDAVTVTDGSGLSTLDRITPRAMVDLLSYAHKAPWAPAFHASLPVAGESELLRNRMRFTPAQGNLHAKTGTTNDVISLGGYVTAMDGEVLAFSFIYNGYDRWNAKSTIDGMGATLASFIRP